MSVDKLAEVTGLKPRAVRKSLDAGHCPTTAKKAKGRWVIPDVEAAAKEMKANTNPRPEREEPSAYSAARGRREAALADIAELDLAARRGALVEAQDIENEKAAFRVVVRTKFLGATSKYRQRCGDLADRHVAVHEALMGELLNELAEDEESLADGP